MNRQDLLRREWWLGVATRRPWTASVVAGVAVGWGVAHSQPCTFKERGGGCALALPYDSTWTGGLVWGLATFVVARVVMGFVVRQAAARRGD